MAGVTFTKQGPIGIATVDNPPVNALSFAVRSGLAEVVARADVDPEVKALILICAGRTFIAGADIREFGSPMKDPNCPAPAALSACRASSASRRRCR
jgi:3-hydroxyacyl-CoA dehydrogenase